MAKDYLLVAACSAQCHSMVLITTYLYIYVCNNQLFKIDHIRKLDYISYKSAVIQLDNDFYLDSHDEVILIGLSLLGGNRKQMI